MLNAVFRKPRILIVGCGDVGLRLAALLRPRARVLALSSSPERVPLLRAAGIVPLLGNLDQPDSLWRLRALAARVVMLAPPPAQGDTDPRSRRLALVLRSAMIGGAPRRGPLRVVYASTSGVYGDCAGALVPETRTPRPATARARRRLDAEAHWRALGRAGASVSVLRVPGIYDAHARSPRERLRRGLPVLRREQDVFTSHIHADDLARALWAAVLRGAAQRIYHVCDDTRMLAGDYLELAAELLGEASPPRLSREQLERSELSSMARSFLSESRRLDNTRMHAELGVRLHHPDVRSGLRTPPATGPGDAAAGRPPDRGPARPGPQA